MEITDKQNHQSDEYIPIKEDQRFAEEATLADLLADPVASDIPTVLPERTKEDKKTADSPVVEDEALVTENEVVEEWLIINPLEYWSEPTRQASDMHDEKQSAFKISRPTNNNPHENEAGKSDAFNPYGYEKDIDDPDFTSGQLNYHQNKFHEDTGKPTTHIPLPSPIDLPVVDKPAIGKPVIQDPQHGDDNPMPEAPGVPEKVIKPPVTFHSHETINEDDGTTTFDLLDGRFGGGKAGHVENVKLISGNNAGIVLEGNYLVLNTAQYQYLGLHDTEDIIFSYEIHVGKVVQFECTYTITITGANDQPEVTGTLNVVASEDATAFSVNLLEGASDPDNADELTITNIKLVEGNTSGIMVISDQLYIDPDAYNYLSVGESELIIYSYQITDGNGGMVEQTATITITGENDSPTISSEITTQITEDDQFTTLDLLQGATDPDRSDELEISGLKLESGDAAGIKLAGNNSLGIDPDYYSYLASGETETITFSYQISDGHGGIVDQTATITITGENDRPQVSAEISTQISEDDQPTIVDLLQGASDPDRNDSLNVTDLKVVRGNASGIEHSGNQLEIKPGYYNYLGVGEFEIITFAYLISDENGGLVQQTAEITVTGENDAPSVSIIDAGQVDETAAPLTINLLETAHDPDANDTLSVQIVKVTSDNSARVVSYSIDENTGELVIDPGQFRDLDTGESENLLIEYQVIDGNGGITKNTATLRVDGITTDDTAQAPILNVPDNIGGYKAIGNEFQVNTHTFEDQSYPDVASLSDGGFVVVWTSWYQDGSYSSVYAQRYDADGIKIGAEFKVNTYSESSQREANVISHDDGGFTVIWASHEQDGTDWGIFGQRYDANCIRVGNEFQVSPDTVEYDSQYYPNVTALNDGSYIVTWHSHSLDNGTGFKGQRFDSDGTPIGKELQLKIYDAPSNMKADITSLESGGFVLVWHHYSDTNIDNSNIFGQIFNDEGIPIGDEFQINSYTGDIYLGWRQEEPDVTSLGEDGFVVTWQSQNQDGSGFGIFGQIFDINGKKVGGEFQVNSYTTGHQDIPSVTALLDGNFVVTWASGSHVSGQLYDSNGNTIGDEFLISSNSSSKEGVTVTALDDGGFIVSWYSGDDSSWGIFAQRFSPAMYENTPAELNISASLTDTDGSETLSILIEGMPSGSSLTTGVDNGNGSWTLTPEQLNGLKFIPPQGYIGNIDLTVTATATEKSTGDTASTGESITLIYSASDDDLASDSEASTPILNVAKCFIEEYEAIGDEFQINSSFKGDQIGSSITSLENGDFVVSWTNSQGADLKGVYFQRFDKNSIAVGEEILASGMGSAHSQSNISALDNGGFVLTWYSDRIDGSDYGVFGQIFDGNGQPQDSQFQINTYTHSAQLNPSVSTLNDGSFVVTWQSNKGITNYEIYGQRYSSDGNPIGEEFLINSQTWGWQYEPSLSALNDGGFVVTWSSENQDGSGYGIYGQRFSANGDAVNSEFLINDHTDSHQHLSEVIALKNGGFAVTWQSKQASNSSDTHISCKIYDSNGDAITDEFNVSTSESNGNYVPSITALDDGGFVVVWGSNQDIYGQRFDEFGTVIGNKFHINTYTNGSQTYPCVESLVDGGFIVSWSSQYQDGDRYGIFAQRFEPVLQQNTPAELNISASLTDTDGSETLSIQIVGVPVGASLSSGINNGDGTWSIRPDQLEGLTFTPPTDFTGNINLTVTATATEISNGETASVTESITLIYHSTNAVSSDVLFTSTNLENPVEIGSLVQNDNLNTHESLIGTDGADNFAITKESSDLVEIINFDRGSDVLDLSDLLIEHGSKMTGIDAYLNFIKSGNDTQIQVDVNLDGEVDKAIQLTDTDLVTNESSGTSYTDSQIVENLLSEGSLKLDDVV